MKDASPPALKAPFRPRIGPAGWSYPDWGGRVYPPKPPKRFDPLQWIARFFSTLEVNSSFYRNLGPRTSQSWVHRVREREDFRFCVKLHRSFTHDDPRISSRELREFEDFLKPLEESGRLGPILAQFPWSFRRTEEHFEYLLKLADSLASRPVVFELRHGSWGDEAGRVHLGDSSLAVVSVDQPVIGNSLPPVLQSSQEILYLRLHGRNRESWFRSGAGRDQRYDYRYRLEELKPWIEALESPSARTRESYIITNNHFQGQAVVNALQIRALLGEDVPEFPSWLEEEFPEIKKDLQRAGATDPRPVSFEEKETNNAAESSGSSSLQRELFREGNS